MLHKSKEYLYLRTSLIYTVTVVQAKKLREAVNVTQMRELCGNPNM
jgi:hypothetical protein